MQMVFTGAVRSACDFQFLLMRYMPTQQRSMSPLSFYAVSRKVVVS